MSWRGVIENGARWWGAYARMWVGDAAAPAEMIKSRIRYFAEARDAYVDKVMIDGSSAALGSKITGSAVYDPGSTFALGLISEQKGRRGDGTLPFQQLMVPVPIRVSRIAKWIPKELDFVSWGGNTLLYIAAQRFDLKPALNVEKSYNEIVYAVPVSYRGTAGLFYLKLHLNWKEGVDIGVEHFGFPKELCTVTYRSDRASGSDIEFAATGTDGRRLFSIAGDEVVGPFAGWWTAAQSAMLHESDAWPSVGYFDRGGTLVHAEGTMTTDQARPFHVKSLDLSYLQQLGVLTHDEARGAWPASLRRGTLGLKRDGDPRVLCRLSGTTH